MKKPIIATTLAGLFVSSEPWRKAHEIGMNELADAVNDSSIAESNHSPDYFKKVERAIAQIYPNLTPEERIKKRRGIYFDRVIELIKKHPEYFKREVVKYFESLKDKYSIALITTNTSNIVNQIVKLTRLEDLFDIKECSLPEEKDDKIAVFKRFVKKHGKPIIYVGSSRKDSYDFCQQQKISCIYANIEGGDLIKDVETAYNLNELKRLVRDKLN